MVSVELIPGYQLRTGSGLDRAKLVKFMYKTYHELHPDRELGHLALTVEQYFSNKTPLWWVEWERGSRGAGERGSGGEEEVKSNPASQSPSLLVSQSLKIGCLWLGNAIDQVSGDRYAHIFLLYVDPEHRHQGIGAALVKQAENWARERGDRQIGLQVFVTNKPALNLYQKLGYQTHSLSMLKSLQ